MWAEVNSEHFADLRVYHADAKVERCLMLFHWADTDYKGNGILRPSELSTSFASNLQGTWTRLEAGSIF